ALRVPTDERAGAPSLPGVAAPELSSREREQPADGDQFARPEVGLRVVAPCPEPIVYHTEQPNENILGGHGTGPSRLRSRHPQSERRPWPLCQLAPVVSYEVVRRFCAGSGPPRTECAPVLG